MRRTMVGLLAGAVTSAMGGSQAIAENYGYDRDRGGEYFDRIATLPNYRNLADASSATVSEIVAASEDGRLLVYTDAETESVGFVGIDVPQLPVPLGTVALRGEPTSVDILGNDYALVGVNTSESFVETSGYLAVIDVNSRAVVAELELGGQPDSLKISPDGYYVAVAIENERDEDIEVDGVEGGLPQSPAGFLAVICMTGAPASWTISNVDLTGLSAYAPQDPEPEFVDINQSNMAVVSLQENNHVVIVDLENASVVGDFDAGTVDLSQIDVEEEDLISLGGSLSDIPREPDAIAWVPGRHYGADRIATANEGDLFGGSRGFSIFEQDGTVVYDSGNAFEHLAVRHGHYPESRSENKGSEPEAVEYGRFGWQDFIFVASERGSFVAVYRLRGNGQPEFHQLLPAPLGPEGVLAIPARNLLVVSGEEDDPTLGVRSSMMIYRFGASSPSYPEIVSADDADGTPIPWSALSGMVAEPKTQASLLAVWDSYYSESRIFRIDASQSPAVITDAITIQGGTGDYDPEGIAVAPDGTYWIASEGNASGSRPNRLLQTDSAGVLISEIGLPAEIEACRAASASTGTLGSGFEGVAAVPFGKSYRLLVAQQRGWDYTTPECEDLDDDAGGLNANGEPNRSRIWVYDPDADSWDSVGWELAPLPENAAWVGLSEITLTPAGRLVVIERDNRTGDWAELKTLATVHPLALRDGLIDAGEKSVRDLIPAMAQSNGWISDKPEGLAVTRGGRMFLVTDNDGVEDWSGETSFIELRGGQGAKAGHNEERRAPRRRRADR